MVIILWMDELYIDQLSLSQIAHNILPATLIITIRPKYIDFKRANKFASGLLVFIGVV